MYNAGQLSAVIQTETPKPDEGRVGNRGKAAENSEGYSDGFGMYDSKATIAVLFLTFPEEGLTLRCLLCMERQ
jgi:hypothetical protein